MCLIAFAVRAHPRYPLVVAANRDEWFERPTAPVHFWTDHAGLLAGRDLKDGGTWLGMTRSGRFAALTNFREPGGNRPGAPTRGRLVERYLSSAAPASAFLASLTEHAAEYNGFNLLCGTLAEGLYYYSNRGAPPVPLGNGVFGLSNHLLDTEWPKVRRSKADLREILAGETLDSAELFALLSHSDPAPDHQLPDTGIAQDWERALSAVHIPAARRTAGGGEGRYGTRSATVLIVGDGPFAELTERTFSSDGGIAGVRRERFAVSTAAMSG